LIITYVGWAVTYICHLMFSPLLYVIYIDNQ
jgi:hypothetical protein